MVKHSVCVLGAGAVGTYLGAKLELTGACSVTLIGREPLVKVVRERGVTVRENGTQRVTFPQAAVSAAGLGQFDLVLLTVRTFDVVAAIPAVRSLRSPEGHVIAFQNGVGSEEALAAALGPESVIVGTLTARVDMETPGTVVRRSHADGVALAAVSNSAIPRWAVDLFAAALPTQLADDYRSLRWSKLLLNMMGAASSAILDMDIKPLLADPGVFRLEQLAFREATRVMDAAGIRSIDLPGYRVRAARVAMRLPRPMAQRVLAPSIVRSRDGRSPVARSDMYRGRTELEAFNGAVARAAETLGRRAPINAALAELVVRLSNNPQERATFRGKPVALLAHLRSMGIRL